MQKTGKIEKLSIGDIRNTTKDNCTKLIDAIGAVVDRNLGMSCSVVSVNHSYEYKILITNKTSSVQHSLSDNETKRELCSIPINASDIEAADGDCIYNDVIYDFFAGRANTYDDKSILQQVSADKIEIVKDWISLEKNSTFTKDHIGKDYLNTKAELTKLPVSKIVIRCNSTNYSIWIVGKNKVIFYDDLPSFAASFFGGLSKLFWGK